MRKKCPRCNGTGREFCEVHGSHVCSHCHGKGCIDTWSSFPSPRWKWGEPMCEINN